MNLNKTKAFTIYQGDLIFLLHCSVFALEKKPENGKFLNLVTSKGNFGGYFQQGVYTYFQKIVS